jgi:hypothetical protein
MDNLIWLAYLVGPAVVTYLLWKTRVAWLPGAVMVIAGIVAFGSISGYHSDDSVVGVWGAVGAGILGMYFLVYGLICLVAVAVAGWARQRPATPPTVAPPPAVELPPAVVVSNVSKI